MLREALEYLILTGQNGNEPVCVNGRNFLRNPDGTFQEVTPLQPQARKKYRFETVHDFATFLIADAHPELTDVLYGAGSAVAVIRTRLDAPKEEIVRAGLSFYCDSDFMKLTESCIRSLGTALTFSFDTFKDILDVFEDRMDPNQYKDLMNVFAVLKLEKTESWGVSETEIEKKFVEKVNIKPPKRIKIQIRYGLEDNLDDALFSLRISPKEGRVTLVWLNKSCMDEKVTIETERLLKEELVGWKIYRGGENRVE